MSTPLPTTKITIMRPNNYADDVDDDEEPVWEDPWDDPQPMRQIATDVPAHIGHFRGKAKRDGANLPEQTFALSADTCDLRKDDKVIDQSTGLFYRVGWVQGRTFSPVPDLNRTSAGIDRFDGQLPGPPG